MSFRIDRMRVELSKQIPVPINDRISFVEEEGFLDEFYACGLTEDDRTDLEMVITVIPTGGEVVPVTKSIRDVFYCVNPPESEWVVIRYAYLEVASTVLLLSAYFGEASLPMNNEEAEEAESYIRRQEAYFTRWYTK